MASVERLLVSEAVGREGFRLSLQNPHSEIAEFADQGLGEWSLGLPDEGGESLVDSSAGKAVQWVPGEGWRADRS